MSDTIDEIRKLLGENKRLKKPFYCEHHPEVNSSTMWGCPDCLRELRERVREFEVVLSELPKAAGLLIRAMAAESQLTKAKVALDRAYKKIEHKYHFDHGHHCESKKALQGVYDIIIEALTELEDKS